jgi:hypothetical protein
MIRALFTVILLLVAVVPNRAQATVLGEYNYIQFCIPDNVCVINRIDQNTGSSIFLLREGQVFPGWRGPLMGVMKDPGSGEFIGNLPNSILEKLQAAGLDTVTVNPEDLEKEIDKAQADIDDNLIDCLWMTAGCGVTGLAALSTGAWGLGAAGIACVSVYRACKALDKANKDLFQKRDEAKAKLEKYARDKAREAGKESSGSSLGIGESEPTSGPGGGGGSSVGTGGFLTPKDRFNPKVPDVQISEW